MSWKTERWIWILVLLTCIGVIFWMQKSLIVELETRIKVPNPIEKFIVK